MLYVVVNCRYSEFKLWIRGGKPEEPPVIPDFEKVKYPCPLKAKYSMNQLSSISIEYYNFMKYLNRSSCVFLIRFQLQRFVVPPFKPGTGS